MSASSFNQSAAKGVQIREVRDLCVRVCVCVWVLVAAAWPTQLLKIHSHVTAFVRAVLEDQVGEKNQKDGRKKTRD